MAGQHGRPLFARVDGARMVKDTITVHMRATPTVALRVLLARWPWLLLGMAVGLTSGWLLGG